MGYLANFMVYTFAMVGVIVVALLVFKNSTSGGTIKKSKYLKVIDSMSLAPRKNLYIISAGEEKFLIAGDADKTTLISKLESTLHQQERSLEIPQNKNNDIEELFSKTNELSFRDALGSVPQSRKHSYMDTSNIGIKNSMLSSNNDTNYTSVIRNLAEKMRG